jgi:tetratricopeptide (TPR) repeat protein
LLQAIAEVPEPDLRRSLGNLQTAEFLYETNLFPDLEYTFKHALTHEVAYGSVLQERRRALHAHLVGAMEQFYADRLPEHIERVANHALRGELWDQAVTYCRQAGTKAADRSAPREGVTWLEQALGTLQKLPETRSTLEQAFDILLELRPLLNSLGQSRKTLERLREAQAIAERLNDDRRRARVCAFLTIMLPLLGEMDEALASGTRALAIAQKLGDLSLRLVSTDLLEQQYFYRGEFGRVIELARGNLAALPSEAVYERFGLGAPVSVFDRFWLVMSLVVLGRFAEATEIAQEAIGIAAPTQRPSTISIAHWCNGYLYVLKGDWARARSVLEPSIEVARAGNVLLFLPAMMALYAWTLAGLGDASEAVKRLQEADHLREFLRGTTGPGVTAPIDGYLGEGYVVLGWLDHARECAERLIQTPHIQFTYPHGLYLLGKIDSQRQPPDCEGADWHYRQALSIGDQLGMRPLVAHCHVGLGKLYWRTDKRDQAREHLATATTMYREMGMTYWLEKAEAEMRELG